MSTALLPVPFFEGPEKRVEIRYVLTGSGTGAGMRDVPAATWSACLAKAGITIESSVHGPEWDCYMLSESSLFVSRTRIICKTCGRSAPLAVIEDALRCGRDHGAEATLVLFSRSDLLRPAEQACVHQSFDSERRYLDSVLPSGTVARAVTSGDDTDAHWALYLATLPSAAAMAPDTLEYIAPTLEIAMYDLDPATTAIWWAETVGTAAAARHYSGLDAALPADATIDEMLFSPCGYSMNCFDNQAPGTHATVHVTPQEVCSFASYECSVLDPSTVSATIRSIVDIFRPGRFSVSFVDLSGDEGPVDLGSDVAAPCGFFPTALSTASLPHGGIVGRQVFGAFRTTMATATTTLPSSSACSLDLMEHEQEQLLQPQLSQQLCSGSSSLPQPTLLNCLAAYGVPLIDEPVCTAELFKQQILQHSLDAPFYIADLGTVEARYRLWRELLPRVEPRYAVKCNSDEILLAVLHTLGCGFDAASEAEIRLAFKAGAHSDEIVFANPVKSCSDIAYARKHSVGMTTFDSAAELEKLAEQWPDAELLLRISTDDSGAACQLSNKYGAQLGEEVHGLILLARSLQLEIVGVSFHCGSGQTLSSAFARSIVDAAAVFEQLRACGFTPHVLDIGGGFPGADAAGAATFAEIADAINTTLRAQFPEHDATDAQNQQDRTATPPTLQVIAEPGRFFAHEAFTLACNIIGKKERKPKADNAADREEAAEAAAAAEEDEEIVCSYTIGDGIYGSFNSLLYDHAVVHPVPLRLRDGNGGHKEEGKGEGESRLLPRPTAPPTAATTVFGPTCDGLDCVCERVQLPSDLSPGRDWLLFEEMGAYTLAAGSNFNGIKRAQVLYIYNSASASASARRSAARLAAVEVDHGGEAEEQHLAAAAAAAAAATPLAVSAAARL